MKEVAKEKALVFTAAGDSPLAQACSATPAGTQTHQEYNLYRSPLMTMEMLIMLVMIMLVIMMMRIAKDNV